MKLSTATVAAFLAIAASTVSATPMFHRIKCDIKRDWRCFKDKIHHRKDVLEGHLHHDKEVIKHELAHWKYDVKEDSEILKEHIHHHIVDFEVRFDHFKHSLESHLEYAFREGISLVKAGARHIEHGIEDVVALDVLLADDIIYHVYYMWEKLGEINSDIRRDILSSYRNLVNEVNLAYGLPSSNLQYESCEAPLLTIEETWETQRSQSRTVSASQFGYQITVIYDYLYQHTHTVIATNPYTGQTTVEQDSETLEQTEVDQTTVGEAPAPAIYSQGRTYTLHGEANRKYQEELAQRLRDEGVKGPMFFEN
ncbi:hypothetical protein FRB96_005790 [Tulasnella sp. 330]|nr:hypothetical protein FRB96_005790 [Tulasnella sp. 330]KAG8875219.1 hypothetical protein FRB98_008008 [Tulasnella sp. 332]KAG8879238.1 hypothetical protein FRB97_001822 [Tulasnella sp. 331]